jgi:hypothetical protein
MCWPTSKKIQLTFLSDGSSEVVPGNWTGG